MRRLHALAKFALGGLSNTITAAEYRTTLPRERSRKKSRGLDVNLIYNVKTRFEHCHVVGALGP